FLVTSVRGIALEPITAASVASGFIGFMNAAFALRFLPFAFFFAVLLSPLNVRTSIRIFPAIAAAGDEKMPNPGERVNAFQRENVLLSLCCRAPARRFCSRMQQRLRSG